MLMTRDGACVYESVWRGVSPGEVLEQVVERGAGERRERGVEQRAQRQQPPAAVLQLHPARDTTAHR